MFKKNKFKIAFVCLVAYLLVQPLVSSQFEILDNLLLYGLIIGFLFSPYFLSRSKTWLAFGVVTVFVIIISSTINDDSKVYFYSTNFFGLTAHFVVILYLFQYIITKDEITDDLVYASLFGYFLLAIGFAHAYNVLDDLGYMQFSPSNVLGEHNDWNYMYYSFTTLTTLGYGDIVPVSTLAKRLSGIEAATGVLYVAVFIGRLIGMHSKNKQINKT